MILDLARRGAHGGRIPQEIQDAPALLPGLDLFMDAWHTLSTGRQISMGGVGPIPWRDIEEYAGVYGIRGDQLEDLHFHVRSLDVVYLRHVAPKEK